VQLPLWPAPAAFTAGGDRRGLSSDFRFAYASSGQVPDLLNIFVATDRFENGTTLS
jgi:hypothetical protein